MDGSIAPEGLPGLMSFGLTDRGLVRERNEDHYLINEQKRLFLVADGMGGHRAGEVASQAACTLFDACFQATGGDAPEALRSSFLETNRLLHAQGAAHEQLRGMGTTLIACHVRGSTAHILHAGDVRGYLWSSGTLERITADQSVVAALLRGGQITPEEARVHPLRSHVLQAVGLREEIQPDYNAVSLESGSLLLLCSDGLWGMVGDDLIGVVLEGGGDLERRGRGLVERALDAGGKDNITVVLIECA